MSIVAGFLTPHPPLIIPEVGGGRELEISATTRSFQSIAGQIAALEPETVVIFTPHSTLYSDYIHISPGSGAKGSLKRFGAPASYSVAYDEAFVRALEKRCAKEKLAAGTMGERDKELDHGVLIPLHFIGQRCAGYKLVRISPSGLSREEHYRLGTLLAETARELGRKTVVLASGDLSHKLTADGPYGFAPEGPMLDEALTGIMASGDFGELFELDSGLCSKGAECGLLPFVMLAGALDGMAVKPLLLSYEGPFGVGYAAASFEVGEKDSRRGFLERRMEKNASETRRRRSVEDAYTRLARETLECYVATGKLPPLPEGLPEEMLESRAGVFVSIKKRGQLRGCIGTTAPTCKNVAEEIRRNAVSSGTRDTRFSPVELDELAELVYSVDVLLPAQPAAADMLDPARYGVIVTAGQKRGLLLPNLEGVNTVGEQLSIARRKAGIPEGQLCDIERFEVVRHE